MNGTLIFDAIHQERARRYVLQFDLIMLKLSGTDMNSDSFGLAGAER